MIGRKAASGLSLLGALMLCALMAQSAMAEAANNTTAVTCVNVGASKGDFKDAHCDENVTPNTGEFAHQEIAKDTTTEISITNEKTAEKTAAASSQLLKGTFAGVPMEITCRKLSGEGTLHNVEPASKQHKITGTATVKYSECEVKKPLKCTVHEPIEFKVEAEGVEKTGPEKNTMGVLIKPDPNTSKVFVEITLKDKDPGSCVFATKPIPVEGTAIATGTPSPTAKHSGATAVFTNEMTKETLKIGGKAAEFSGSATVTMKGGGSPIALTTTT